MRPRATHRMGVIGVLLAAGMLIPPPGAEAATIVVDSMRGLTPIPEQTTPPLLGNAVNDDQRRPRNYEMQPPTIPHRVDGYQIDKNFNKCLDCHARAKTEFSGAVPVSATHYIDRNGKVLDHVSTRRYFCPQCHVAQDAVKPLVGNSFEDADALSRKAAGARRPGRSSAEGSP